MATHAQAVLPLMRGREGLLRWSNRRRTDAPFFAALGRIIADDDELFRLSEETTEGQPTGRLMLSAIHFLLLQNPDQPLADYFPTLAPSPKPVEDITPALKAFCREHREAIVGILRHRTLQTTGTDRAARVLLALDEVARSIGEPFSLVEVGCSAGLLLLFDHYRYEFGDGTTLGPTDARTIVSAFKFVGRRPPLPSRFPLIERRIGLDLNPVDVGNPDERNWILGCIVADRVNEFEEMRQALEYRASVPLELITGDALETLPRALETIDGPICVLHSWCLYQWPAEAQDAFDAMLKRLSEARTIHRVGIESTAQSAEHSMVEIRHTIYCGGCSETRVLGLLVDNDKLDWQA